MSLLGSRGRLDHGSFCRFKGGETREKTIHMSDFEQDPDSFGKTDNREATIRPLAGSEQADHRSQARGIHVGHARNVQNHWLRGVLTSRSLEFEQRLKREWSAQLHDLGAFGSILEFDDECFRGARCHESQS